MSEQPRIRLKSRVTLTRLSPRQFAIYDPALDSHFELGPEERFILHQLTSSDPIDDLPNRFQQQFGQTISWRAVANFVEQLRQHQLLEGSPPPVESPATGGADSLAYRPGLNFFFDLLASLFGWLVHPLALAPALIIIAVGGGVFFRYYPDMLVDLRSTSSRHLFLPLFLASFLQTVLLLNLPHALFIGMAVRRLGGSVHGFGFMRWRGVLPLVRIDTGLSLWLASDRDRRRFLVAEFLFPLVMGALFCIAWRLSDRHETARIFFTFNIAPCIVGFVFLQCNIFVMHSAYWALCARLGDWRLQDRAKAETRAWLALQRSPEALTRRERFWLRLYGLGYYGGHGLIDLGVIVALGALLLAGRGDRDPTVFVFALGAMAGVTRGWNLGARFVPDRLRWLMRGGGAWYVRWPLRIAVVAAVIACGFIPYTHEIGGEFRLAPLQEHSARAQISSEVAEVRIKAGDRVSGGSVIAVLHARDQRRDVETTRHALAEAQAEYDLAQHGFRKEQVEQALQEAEMYRAQLALHEREFNRISKLHEQKQSTDAQFDSAKFNRESSTRLLAGAEEKLAMLSGGSREEEIRAAKAKAERLAAELAHYETELSLAEVVAPGDGQWTVVRVPAKLGQYVHPGDLIAVLDDDTKLRAEIFATEDAAVYIKKGQLAKLRMPGYHEGELLTAHVDSKARSAIHRDEIDVDPYRTDREFLSKARMTRQDDRYVRIYADLEHPPADLVPYMTGHARVVISDDLLWHAVARPIVRFARTEIWSWLP
jgi:HlyD family secretion protein